MTYSEAQLAACLKTLGVAKGDCLFIHAALKSLGKFTPQREGDAFGALLAVLLDAVGQDGTVVVPTFNFGFCQGQPFDRQNTPGEGMGAFSEFIRRHPSALRSRHPFQCVAAIGRLAAEIADARGRSAFAPGGAFDLMLHRKCKILFFGVYFVETFVHVAEERADVPYRFWKTFTADYIDAGVSNRIAVDFFARKLDLVPEPAIDNHKLGRLLREKGIISSTSLGSGEVSICDATVMVDELTERLKQTPSYALQVE
jgi:aminoglycoside 3-N-acetyltransferase